MAAEEERLAAEKAAREAIPAGDYSYVAPVGGYRGFITVNGDGTMSLMEVASFNGSRDQYAFTLERTDSTAPNGNVIYNAVPTSGTYSAPSTIYYDAAQGGVVFRNNVFTGPA